MVIKAMTKPFLSPIARQLQGVPFTYLLACTQSQAEKWFTLGENGKARQRDKCAPQLHAFLPVEQNIFVCQKFI